MQRRARNGKIGWWLVIILASSTIGMVVGWRAPGIDRYARDLLMRARGPLPAPDDIAIVAIDEPSIRRLGRFPWPRSVMAKTLDALTAAQPKAIALDVLYTDPSSPEDDEELAEAVGRAGNVVLAAQLAGAGEGAASRWLLPLPCLGEAAAAIAHVNVQVESEGVAREIEVRSGDDTGRTFGAMATEVVRVADGTAAQNVVDTGRALAIGPRIVPLDFSAPAVLLGPAAGLAGSAVILRGGRLAIDYIGPAGSFASNTFSLADVAAGKIPAAKFRGKYVLIGATAASLGDRLASPFMHVADGRGEQYGSLMPGVEVLANAVNTILRSRFYSEPSDAGTFVWLSLIAAVTLSLLDAAQGRLEALKETAALAGVAAAVVIAGYVAFTRWMLFPPLAPGMASFASAGLLGFMRRSWAASSRLDASISELAHSDDLLPPPVRQEKGRRAGQSAHAAERLAQRFPRGLEWKARNLVELNARLVARARFVDRALRSVEDGLIIASPDGRITFANQSAASMLESTAQTLVGQGLLERLLGAAEPDLLAKVVEDRAHVEREIAMRDGRSRRCTLRMVAVSAGDDETGPVLGIVASLSDITRHYELQQTKNDVVALVSHEMRTPLTAIQGMTELLAEYELDPVRRREMHLAINDEVKRLARMITEYLDITRLESGATMLRPSALRVESIVDRTLLLLEPLAVRRGIRLTRWFSPALPGLLADPDLISRAVENLVSNAIKYSAVGAEVRVSAKADSSAVYIEVADEGYGIPEADLARIFEKFYRVPRAEDAEAPGTGLGLSLVREIAELHGGSISVTSTVNTGSTFTLRIPMVGRD